MLSGSLLGDPISTFEFNDPAGTGIGSAVDSAGGITEVVETGPGEGNYVTDGSAAVYGTGVIEPVGSNSDGSMFKIRLFDTPLTAADWKSVSLSFVVDFSFTDTDSKGAKAGFSLTSLVGETHEKVAEIGVQHLTNNQARPQYIANDGKSSTVVPDPTWGMTQSGYVLSCTVDFENGMLYYFYDAGAGPVEFYSEATSYTVIDAIRIVAAKGATRLDDANEYIKIDRMEVTGLPTGNGGGGDDWNGYTILDDGWTDTDTWMGWLNVTDDPWVVSASLDGWIYIPTDQPTESGAWVYFLK
jgi:hypothetical protein